MTGSYLNKYSKLAKHCVKGKISLTLAVIVSLMITGQAAMGATDLNGGIYKVESNEFYSEVGFNVESGSNAILFNHEGEDYSVVVKGTESGIATGVSITGGNSLLLAEEALTEGNISVEAVNSAVGIELALIDDYTLNNSVDFNLMSAGSTEGISSVAIGDEGNTEVINQGNITTGDLETRATDSKGIETYNLGNNRTDIIENSGILSIYASDDAKGIENITIGNSNLIQVNNDGEIKAEAYRNVTGIEVEVSGYENSIDVSNTGKISASSETKVANGIKVSTDGDDNEINVSNTGEISAYSHENHADGIKVDTDGDVNTINVLNTGNIVVDIDEKAKGIYSKLNGNENILNISNDNLIDIVGDKSAKGIEVEVSGNDNEINVSNTGEMSASSETKIASGIKVDTDGGGNSINVSNTGEISASSDENHADGINIDAYGDNNSMDVSNEGDIYADSSYEASGISSVIQGGEKNTLEITNEGYVKADSDEDAAGISAVVTDLTGAGNTITVINNSKVYAYANDAADGIYGELNGDGNTLNITNNDYIEADGDDNADGIDAEVYGDSNTVNASNTGNIYAYSDDEDASGIEVDTEGNKNIITISNEGKVKGEEEEEIHGIEVYAYEDAEGIDVKIEGSDNTVDISNAGDMYVYSDDDDATGIEVDAEGEGNTVVVKNTGYIESAGYEDADVLDVAVDGYNNSMDVSNEGEIYANSAYEASGIEADVNEEGNTSVVRNSGKITAEADYDYASGIEASIEGFGNTSTINNSGTITATVDTTDTEDGTEGYVYAAGIDTQLYGENITADATNSGTITATAINKDEMYGSFAAGMSTGFTMMESPEGSEVYNSEVNLTNSEEGTITVSSDMAVGMVAGVYGEKNEITVENDGEINAQGMFMSAGQIAVVEAADTIIDMDNSGTITSEAMGYANGMVEQFDGINLTSNMTNSGEITASTTEEEESYAVGMSAGLMMMEGPEESEIYNSEINVTNSEEGTITVSSSTAVGMAAGVYGADNTIAMTNAGTITAEADDYATGIEADVNGTLNNLIVTNSGAGENAGIEVTGENRATGIYASMTEYGMEGEEIVEKGSLKVTNEGDIDSVAGASAIGMEVYAEGLNLEASVSNSGYITAESESQATGVSGNIYGEDVKLGISNSGTIEAKTTGEERGYAVGMSTGSVMDGPVMMTMESQGPGMHNYNNEVTLTNTETGLIKVSSDMAVGIEAGISGVSNDLTVINSGAGENAGIEVIGEHEATGIYASMTEYGMEGEEIVEEGSLKVTNEGDIDAVAGASATGIDGYAGGTRISAVVSNTGTITATSLATEEGEGGYATGVSAYVDGNSNTLDVNNSGTVTAEAEYESTGISAGMYGYNYDEGEGTEGTLTVSNAGIITATAVAEEASEEEVYAIGIETQLYGENIAANVINSGTITASATGDGENYAAGMTSGLSIEDGFEGAEIYDSNLTMTNTAEGSISASGTFVGAGMVAGVDGMNNNITLDNAGDINAEGMYMAVGQLAFVSTDEINEVEQPQDITTNLTMENSGTITSEAMISATGMMEQLDGENIVSDMTNSGTIISTTSGEGESYATGMSTGFMMMGPEGSEVYNSEVALRNSEEGSINVSSDMAMGIAAGVYGDGNNVTVTNAGEISTEGEYGATGITAYVSEYNEVLEGNESYLTVINEGEIDAVAGASAVGIEVYGDSNTVVSNSEIGQISAEGEYATGIFTDLYADVTGEESTIINAGSINVSGEEVYGINSSASLVEGSSVTVNNSGLIEVSGENGAGVAINGDGEFTNSGTIVASGGTIGVDMSSANTTYVTNSGTIVSEGTAILMNSQDNQIILTGGDSDITGIVDGGAGEDTIVLRDGADIQFETENISIISVESGESHIVAGTTVELDTASDPEEGETLTPAEGTTLVIDEGSTVVLNINTEGETSRLDAELIDIDGEVIVSTSFLDDITREELINDEGESEYHYYYVFTGEVEGFENISVDSYAWSAAEGSLILYKGDYVDITDGSKLAGIAEVLDNNNMNPEFETVLDELDKTATEAEFRDGLEQIAGNMYASVPAMALQTTKIFDKNVKNFINLDSEKDVEQYISIIGESGDYDGNDKNEGFDYQSFGFVGATEKKVSGKNSIGVSYGYADTSVDHDDAGSNSSDYATGHVGVYHEYQGETWQVATRASYEFNNVEAERKVDFEALDYNMESDFDVNVMSIGTELSTVYQAGEWKIKPLAGLTYSYIDQDEIKESGGDLLNINIDSETYNSIRSEIGVRVERKTSFGSFNGLVSWNHEFGDVYDDMDATLEGAASDSYKIYGLEDMEDTYTVGAGITIGNEESLSYNLNYSFTGNSEYTENTASAGIRYTF